MELLANKLRPKTLNKIYGQTHLIGENKVLNNLVKKNKIFNIIFYGNPGTGKTTIALALVNDLNKKYRLLNATINNKKDFEIVFEESKIYDDLILIVDEIHRMNKDKQDLLLSYLESGKITLIGLTSSNPYLSVNKAIRSRCELLELKPLDSENIKEAIINSNEEFKDLNLTNDVVDFISKTSNGDLRYAYNLIEFCYYGYGPNFTTENIIEINNKGNILFDKNEDEHYNLLSALQKSIRGSDVNASLFYLAKLIMGNDIESIIRRLSVIAYEDIGLANPLIGVKLDAAINAALRVGLPEAKIPLGEIIIEMALSPKSNSCYKAVCRALEDINNSNSSIIPNHIKSSAIGYKYPHDYKNNYIKQQYLPDDKKNVKYYIPGNNKYEFEINKFNEKIRND